VAILDADKEGFLRSEKSLTQTAGRAARNINGKVIMYADEITRSMQRTIDETDRRRVKQLKYNTENNITPQQIIKASKNIMGLPVEQISRPSFYIEKEEVNIAADPLIPYMDAAAIKKTMDHTRKAMEKAAKQLDFIEAARLRDELYALQEILKKKG
jgi:excinuclease ABC subunit B